jgi:cell wall-associated NlpC family hydrolase
MNTRAIVCLFLTLTLAACASPGGGRQTMATKTSGAETMPFHDKAAVSAVLRSQHAAWGGTRYKLGGMGRDGIDCSGFTYVTFANRFGLRLPRTAVAQSQLGESVLQHELRPGDLVFFRTGFKTRHVGIYAGNRSFLHASTSGGVMMSSLDNPYWRKKYWKARRVSM